MLVKLAVPAPNPSVVTYKIFTLAREASEVSRIRRFFSKPTNLGALGDGENK